MDFLDKKTSPLRYGGGARSQLRAGFCPEPFSVRKIIVYAQEVEVEALSLISGVATSSKYG